MSVLTFGTPCVLRVLSILPVFAAIVLTIGFAAPASADVGKVNSHLQRAEANLKSVAASIVGKTTPPTGSAGKLLATRLEQALGDITPAKTLLAQVPAGTAGRDEAQARCDEAEKEYNRLHTFLTGSAAPAATPQQTGTKLNYQQEEVLSGARFNLREVEGGANHLTAAVEKLRENKDELSIDFREVGGLLGTVENAKRKSGFVKDALDKLPADGAGVAEVRQALVNADAKVVTAADFLTPLDAKLKKLIDPAQYPQFEADRNRLRDLSAMFANPTVFQTDRVLATSTYQQAEAARAECVRVAQVYARLVQQGTEQGKSIEGTGNSFLQNLAKFMAEAEVQKAALPDAIRADMNTAKEYAAKAVAEQMPAWFTGGIPQVMGTAEERVNLLAAMDEAAGKQMRGEWERTQKELMAQADSLRELIIRENKLPKDEFKGEDREKAIATALSGWKVQQDKAEVLAIRIPAEQWSRQTKWEYSNGTWYFSDRSKLQVRLFVVDHENPTLAIDRPINVWKDHEKGDTMIGVPLHDFKEKLQPQSYLLRANVKK